jgi:hypothetical protein
MAGASADEDGETITTAVITRQTINPIRPLIFFILPPFSFNRWYYGAAEFVSIVFFLSESLQYNYLFPPDQHQNCRLRFILFCPPSGGDAPLADSLFR